MAIEHYSNNGGGIVTGIEYDPDTRSGKILLSLSADPVHVAETLKQKGFECEPARGIYQNGLAHLTVGFTNYNLVDVQESVAAAGLVKNPHTLEPWNQAKPMGKIRIDNSPDAINDRLRRDEGVQRQ